MNDDKKKQVSPDQEVEFSTKTSIVPKSNSNVIYDSLTEMDIQGASLYAFYRFPQVWSAYMESRHNEEEGMNLYKLKENQRFDDEVAKVMKNKSITDDRKLFDFLLHTYSDSGARKEMNRIKVVLKDFREEWKAQHNGKKEETG